MVLEDNCGGISHTIMINKGLKIIYYCMETHEMQLNHEHLSKCCGPNRVFIKFYITAELTYNKVHARKIKDEITMNDLFKKIL